MGRCGAIEKPRKKKDQMEDRTMDWLEDLWNAIVDFFTGIWDGIVDLFDGIF